MKSTVSKFSILLTLLVIGSLVITGCTSTPATTAPASTAPATAAAPKVQDTMNLKFAFGGPNSGTFAETIQWFCDELGKRTNGKVNVTVHWGGSLIKQLDTTVGVGKGVADMGVGMGSPTVSQNPNWSTLGVLGAGQDPWAIAMATWEMNSNNPKIMAEFDKHNVIGTHGYFPGTPVMFLKKEIKSLSDLKGLRIRVGTPDDAVAVPKLGMEPVQVGLYDLYDSISKGVIDGTQLTVSWADTLKFSEVAKYWYTYTNNLVGGDITTVINKDVWNKFTPETQAIVKQLIKEFNNKYVQATMKLEASVIAKVQASDSVKFQKIPEDANTAYQGGMAIARQAWFDKWDSQGNSTKAVWDEYQKYVAQYQKQVAEKGYPWAPK
jgi:TRAP-type C4-dicarboxylate transport system substrate-binding protein